MSQAHDEIRNPPKILYRKEQIRLDNASHNARRNSRKIHEWLHFLGDLAHDVRAAAEVQNLANTEVGAPRVDIRVSSEVRVDGDAVGLGDVDADLATLDGVGVTVQSRLRFCRRSAELRCSRRRSTDWGSGGGTVRGTIALDVLARVGELDILVFLRRPSVVDVGDEHVWVVIERRGAVALDGDVRAVHIHISATRLAEPRPCPDYIASLGFGGNGKDVDLILVEDVSTSRADAIADE